MLDDVLSKTPLALHIQKQGADKARQEELARQRQTLFTIVQTHFPALTELAEKQAANLDKPEVVNLLVINLIVAKNEEEARTYLQQAGKKRRKRA